MVLIRTKIREKYGIDGNLVNDILGAWCCTICAVSQQTRQLDIRGDRPASVCMGK
jgi:Cys-rich protein (TIGR01571 family)